MPTYDYRCADCGIDFEIRQSFSENTLKKCPKKDGPAACENPGKGKVTKVFSAVGISFKGDGFYKNDHGSNKKKSSAGESAGSDSSASSSSDASSTDTSSSSDSSSSGPSSADSTKSSTKKADSKKGSSKKTSSS